MVRGWLRWWFSGYHVVTGQYVLSLPHSGGNQITKYIPAFVLLARRVVNGRLPLLELAPAEPPAPPILCLAVLAVRRHLTV